MNNDPLMEIGDENDNIIGVLPKRKHEGEKTYIEEE